jgi:hypothetical protein
VHPHILAASDGLKAGGIVSALTKTTRRKAFLKKRTALSYTAIHGTPLLCFACSSSKACCRGRGIAAIMIIEAVPVES